MKKFLIIFCLLLCQFLLAQNDTVIVSKPKIGVISVDKLNVVYRGIQNPISIAVPNAKSFKASGLGVTFSNGHYFISPGQGNEVIVTLEIILEDDSKVVEEHVFRIKNIPRPLGKINNRNCDSYVTMDITELKNAKISVYQDDFLFDWNFEVTSFVIKKEKKPAIIVDGNTINENTLSELNRLKKGDIITIAAIKYKVSPNINALWPNIPPILILITD
jgi:gliding motility-associated protein GldM